MQKFWGQQIDKNNISNFIGTYKEILRNNPFYYKAIDIL